MIVIDTSAAFFTGDNENDNTQIGEFARSLRQLTGTKMGRPCAITLSHPIKHADRDKLLPRGGGAFLAEIDGNLTLWSPAPGTAELHWQGKFRGPSFEPMSWRLDKRESPHLVDAKGRKIPNVIATLMSDEDQQRMVAAARSDEDAVLENVLAYPNASYAARCRRLGWVQANGEPAKSRLFRIVDTLVADRLLKRQRGVPALTEAGKKEAERSLMRGSK